MIKIISIFISLLLLINNKRKQNPILVGISCKRNMNAIVVQLDTRVAMLNTV